MDKQWRSSGKAVALRLPSGNREAVERHSALFCLTPARKMKENKVERRFGKAVEKHGKAVARRNSRGRLKAFCLILLLIWHSLHTALKPYGARRIQALRAFRRARPETNVRIGILGGCSGGAIWQSLPEQP